MIASLMAAVTAPYFNDSISLSFLRSVIITHTVAVPSEITAYYIKNLLNNVNVIISAILTLSVVILLNLVIYYFIRVVYFNYLPFFADTIQTTQDPEKFFLMFILIPSVILSISLTAATILIDRMNKTEIGTTGFPAIPASDTIIPHNDLNDFPSVKADPLLPQLQGIPSSISIKEDEDFFRIKPADIIYISAHGMKSAVHTLSRTYVTARPIGDLLKERGLSHLLRIHRSYAVNTEFIKRSQYYIGGRYLIYLNDDEDTELTVGRKYASDFKTAVGI
jgi:hypothetical protein